MCSSYVVNQHVYFLCQIFMCICHVFQQSFIICLFRGIFESYTLRTNAIKKKEYRFVELLTLKIKLDHMTSKSCQSQEGGIMGVSDGCVSACVRACVCVCVRVCVCVCLNETEREREQQ